jgi:hypothetical protein
MPSFARADVRNSTLEHRTEYIGFVCRQGLLEKTNP